MPGTVLQHKIRLGKRESSSPHAICTLLRLFDTQSCTAACHLQQDIDLGQLPHHTHPYRVFQCFLSPEGRFRLRHTLWSWEACANLTPLCSVSDWSVKGVECMRQRRQGWWNGRVERGEETEAEAQSREGQREGRSSDCRAQIQLSDIDPTHYNHCNTLHLHTHPVSFHSIHALHLDSCPVRGYLVAVAGAALCMGFSLSSTCPMSPPAAPDASPPYTSTKLT